MKIKGDFWFGIIIICLIGLIVTIVANLYIEALNPNNIDNMIVTAIREKTGHIENVCYDNDRDTMTVTIEIPMLQQ